MLPTPTFHHVHLNSPNPDAAIDFYVRQFASTSKSTWGGMAALQSPNNVMLLFNKVAIEPPVLPQSAIWHYGWHVTDVRKKLAEYKTHPEVNLMPLYTEAEGGYVYINSDTWPNVGNVLGLTKAQIAEAKAKNLQPKGGGGFAYMSAPDGTLVEYIGDHPAERFNHVHMWQEQPFCAQLWYQTHLNAPPMPGWANTQPMTEATCKVARGPDRTWPSLNQEGMFRTPRAGVMFGDVAVQWYAPQGDAPLVPSRGQRYDHLAFGVADLDAWIAKLKGEGVTFLEGPYKLGDTRAVMIEGPSREALELVEIKNA
jgi:catechol 2,3-dioxygenase-like lactoylglutathione lyase family enzyme